MCGRSLEDASRSELCFILQIGDQSVSRLEFMMSNEVGDKSSVHLAICTKVLLSLPVYGLTYSSINGIGLLVIMIPRQWHVSLVSGF